ncbi:fibronectin type III domain-containing protein [Kribbella sp. CA-293567]|uniref:fibronectin type III domain-containing protein n=1 Tax=Kribbella sp. CA-293567 TaxID=3002436 RepID=UPI0022DE560C|nr:fibronectin type III domain-containing protein [Kribbella sp. CA-293567]WBQ08416.1 fibronectin type III domain-containing protein [Kribbella sp. CA-293567]
MRSLATLRARMAWKRLSGPASGSRTGEAREAAGWRPKVALAAVVAACMAATSIAVTGGGSSASGLRFAESGHYIYNSTVGKIFHIDGGTKTADTGFPVAGAAPGSVVVQSDTSGYVLGRGGITEFGKSDLEVVDPLPVPVSEQPIGLEAAGLAYAVYPKAGRIWRSGSKATLEAVGGPVGQPVVTRSGALWVHKLGSGELCQLAVEAERLSCPATAPAGHTGSLTTVGDRVVFVDTTADVMRVVDQDGFGRSIGLAGLGLTGTAVVAANDVDGRVAIVDPEQRRLHLVDPAGLFGDRQGKATVQRQLRPGTYRQVASSGTSLALFDESSSTLLTMDREGNQKNVRKLPAPSDPVQRRESPVLFRGGDSRIYVDGPTGEHVMVMDDGGEITSVETGKAESNEPKNPPASPPPVRTSPTPPPVRTPPPPSVPARTPPTAPTTQETSPTARRTEPTNRPSGRPTTTRSERPPTRPADPPPSTEPPPSQKPPVTARAGRPGAPRGLTAEAGTASARVSWAAAPANGATITQYLVTWAGGSARAAGSARSIELTGLVDGTAYRFAVRAVNRIGEGPGVSTAAVTPARAADAPTALRATPGSDSLTVGWAQPNLRGGALSNYRLSLAASGNTTYQAESGQPWVFSGSWSAAAPDTHTRDVGATATLRFSGTRIQLYGVLDDHHGIASIAVDGRTVQLDQYRSSRQENSLFFTSAQLPAGSHTLVVTMTNQVNPRRVDDGEPAFSIDRAVVTNTAVVEATATRAGHVFTGLSSGTGYRVTVRAITRRQDGQLLTGQPATATAVAG